MRQITVTEHLLLHQKRLPMATGQFTGLLNELIFSAKIINREVRSAGLGAADDINIQGEKVRELNVYANQILINRMQRVEVVCALASEENANLIEIPPEFQKGDYFLVFDPLDGSRYIDANINIGTIFGIYRRKGKSGGRSPMLSEILQPGAEQVAAGYFIYGSSTVMVYTTGAGVNGFTLDPSVGEFLLSHPNIRTPENGKIYSVNESYWHYWDEEAREAVAYFKNPDNSRGQPYSLRYIGSLVADFHRNLLYGGIFMYPADCRDTKTPTGKLRLLFEASPLGMIIEQAGGMATDGLRRVLDIEPEDLHQRVPLFIGSRNDVLQVQAIFARGSANSEHKGTCPA